MSQEYSPSQLPILNFAKASAQLEGVVALQSMERLRSESLEGSEAQQVHFSALGALVDDAAGVPEPWVHLQGEAVLKVTCQRCLAPMDLDVAFERDFRFVATEALAEVEDEESEEDVLVLSREFNLLQLVEDELLMAVSPVPMHETCPVPPKLQAVDAEFDAAAGSEAPHPFAALQALKDKGLG
jgi:uncharacterized protein